MAYGAFDETVCTAPLGPKSNVHYQSLLPLEVRVPRNSIPPRSPEDTINMKVSATKSSQQNEFPATSSQDQNKHSGHDLDSREEFPDLKPSNGQKQVKPRTSSRIKEMEISARKINPIDVQIGKETNILNPVQKSENTCSSNQYNKNKLFKLI